MEDKQLLVFRCGDNEYGVPVDDVCEVIGDVWLNGEPVLGIPDNGRSLRNKPISILKLYPGGKRADHNRIIVIQSRGIQIAILVDEIIKVINMPITADAGPTVNVASFQIWNLPRGSSD